MEKTNRGERMNTYQELLCKSIACKQDYLDYVRSGFEEWARGSRKNNPPQFFTGDINSKLAVISLNPHSGEASPNSEIDYRSYCVSWEKYLSFFSNFCFERYAPCGCAANVINRLSNFDKELHCFFGGKRVPRQEDLAKWKIFHVEIFHIETTKYTCPPNERSQRCLSLLRALEAISLFERSMVVLLNRDGCNLIETMNRNGIIRATLEKDSKYPIIPNKGKPERNARRIDYGITLPNRRFIKLVATPSFPLKQVGNRFDFMERYYQNAFSDEEKKLLAQGLGL